MIFLRLLRLPNLVILAVTLYITTRYIIYPPIIAHNIKSAMTSKELILLIFIAMCIGAGGYVYNDIVDIEGDEHNDKRHTIGQGISKGIGLALYIFLTLAPVPFMLSLCMELERLDYMLYYFAFVIMLWLYSRYLKGSFLIGNVVVALLCAMAIMIPFFIEYDALQQLALIDIMSHRQVTHYIIGFGIFSFTSNLIREIVKDAEDLTGDTEMGYRTLPIIYGHGPTRLIIITLTAGLFILISIWIYLYLGIHQISIYVGSALLLFPLVGLIYKSMQLSNEETFSQLSLYWKMYFIIGLLVLVIFSNATF